jgi:hypothetical protein
MSSNTSINMSNISLAESSILLPFSCPPTPAPPAMSPHTVVNTLRANNDLNKEILRTITNGLLLTIFKRETNTTITHHQLSKSIHSLKEKVCHYEQTFNTPPPGYTVNDNHIPHLQIPVAPNLYRLAKWVKLNPNGTVSAYTSTQGPNNDPFIFKLYAQPNYKYNKESNPVPSPPVPAWFQHLLIRPTNEFQLLRNAVADTGDWGISREIQCYRDLDDEVNELSIKLDILSSDLNAAHNHCSCSKACLQMAQAPEKTTQLQNIKPATSCSAWKRQSNGHGCPF